MIKQQKLLLTLGAFIGSLFLAVVFWHLITRHGAYRPNPIRPKDFPKILIAPEDAVLIGHRTPSGSQCVAHTYGFTFMVADPYPSEKTREFIKEHLISNGWQRLNYHLLNPDVPIEYPDVMMYKLRQESNNLEQYAEDSAKNRKFQWTEDWVNADHEHINVSGTYPPLSNRIGADFSKIYINMGFFEKDSWVRPYILKYKELHPDEFDESVTACEPDR